MGKIVRRTVTITITETWTIVWTTEDDPPEQATTVVQDPSQTKEEAYEALQATVIAAEPGKLSASEPTALLTPDATIDPQPDGESTRLAASSRSRRTQRGRKAGK